MPCRLWERYLITGHQISGGRGAIQSCDKICDNPLPPTCVSKSPVGIYPQESNASPTTSRLSVLPHYLHPSEPQGIERHHQRAAEVTQQDRLGECGPPQHGPNGEGQL